MKVLWTDGSASPNPGPGGFAVIDATTRRPVCLGRADHTTNIRMEACAMIAAIEFAGSEPCELHTDSQFWINVLEQWAPTWSRSGWRKKSGEIKNLDLVQKLYQLYQSHSVTLVWVRGHVGTELNELADQWANRARAGATIDSLQGEPS